MDFKNFIHLHENDPKLLNCIIDFFIGNRIGEGCSRTVYEYTLDPKYVVKIPNSINGFSNNLIEFEIYGLLKGTEQDKWLAESKWCSSDGSVLIQRKTKEIGPKDLPDNLPSFFTDIKPSNFGKIGRQIVCHDYAASLLRFVALTNLKKTQKVKKSDRFR